MKDYIRKYLETTVVFLKDYWRTATIVLSILVLVLGVLGWNLKTDLDATRAELDRTKIELDATKIELEEEKVRVGVCREAQFRWTETYADLWQVFGAYFNNIFNPLFDGDALGDKHGEKVSVALDKAKECDPDYEDNVSELSDRLGG